MSNHRHGMQFPDRMPVSDDGSVRVDVSNIISIWRREAIGESMMATDLEQIGITVEVDPIVLLPMTENTPPVPISTQTSSTNSN